MTSQQLLVSDYLEGSRVPYCFRILDSFRVLAVHFTEQEWALLHPDLKDLYKEVMWAHHENVTSLSTKRVLLCWQVIK